MGIGKNQDLALRVNDLLQLLEVHLIALASESQRVHHHLAAILLGHMVERMIYGWLDDYLIALLGQCIDNHTDTLHDAGDVTHPFAFYFPAVV